MLRWAKSHRTWLFLGLLLVIGGVIGEAAGRGEAEPTAPLESRDSSPEGTLALAQWLERLGYGVNRNDDVGHRLEESRTLFLLDPVRPYDEQEVATLLTWVGDGGALVYLPHELFLPTSPFGSPQTEHPLNQRLGLRRSPVSTADQVSAFSPFFSSPPATGFAVDDRGRLELTDDAWTPLLTDESGKIIAAGRRYEQGAIYAAGVSDLFKNNGLGEADNSAFVLNVLARHGGPVTFDEEHHVQVALPTDLLTAARGSPLGWAAAYGAFTTFVFLVWGGFRFGPAIQSQRLPLSTGDYISAFAGLLQRARAVTWTQQQYARLFRQRLARVAGTPRDVPVELLARQYDDRYPGTYDAIVESLSALEGAPLSEGKLLGAVRELDEVFA